MWQTHTESFFLLLLALDELAAKQMDFSPRELVEKKLT